MHPRTQELLVHLAGSRAEVAEALASVASARREVKPGADEWSVAEIIEHLASCDDIGRIINLAIVEGRIGTMLARDVTAAKETGLARETSDTSVLATLDIAGLKDRGHKRAAGEPSRPTGTLTCDEAWSRLEASRAQLEQAIRDADGWALETLSQSHPRLGALNLYQWVAFVGAHESRHAAQILDVRQALDR